MLCVIFSVSICAAIFYYFSMYFFFSPFCVSLLSHLSFHYNKNGFLFTYSTRILPRLACSRSTAFIHINVHCYLAITEKWPNNLWNATILSTKNERLLNGLHVYILPATNSVHHSFRYTYVLYCFGAFFPLLILY